MSSLSVRVLHCESVSPTRLRLVTPSLSQEVAERIKGALCRGGVLEFRLVHEQSDQLLRDNEGAPGYEILEREEARRDGTKRIEQVVVRKKAERGLRGTIIQQASVILGMREPEIHFILQADAAAAFAKVTRENLHRRLAIVIDGKLFSAPVIQSPIETGSGQITGQFTLKEATELASALSNPLPFPITVVEVKNF
jgi:preprotein translocase subunit SecD